MAPFFSAVPILLAIYYAILIAAKPRAPKPASIMVRYEPPRDLSPAAARYVWTGTVDQRTIASVFAGLATKGRITLARKGLTFTLHKVTPPATAPALDSEEQSTMDWLFSNFLEQATFNPGRDAQGCISSLRGQLDRRLKGKYKVGRAGWVALGLLGAFAASMAMAAKVSARSAFALKFTGVLFGVAFLAAMAVAYMLIPAVVAMARGTGRISRLALALAISGGVIACTVAVAKQLMSYDSLEFALLVCLLVAINIAAAPLLSYPTPRGIAAQREIEGFREYLLKVEQDPLDRMVQPDTLPPPSAGMLAYAIALEVKEAWGDDLANACYIG